MSLRLSFFLLIRALVGRRPRTSPAWSCPGQPAEQVDITKRLKGQIGNKLKHSWLFHVILSGDISSEKFLDLMTQDACPAARWTMELLTVEKFMFEEGAGEDWARNFGAASGMHSPVAMLFSYRGTSLFSDLLLNHGPSWSAVHSAGWNTFGLLERLSKAFLAYLQKRGMSQNLSSALHPILADDQRRTASEVSEVLLAAVEVFEESLLNASWQERAAAAETVEDLLRGWSRAALSVGFNAWDAVALLLADPQAPELFRRLDDFLLPDGILLCLPAMVPGTQATSSCRARHCTRYWGINAATRAGQAAAAAQLAPNSSSGSALSVFRIQSGRAYLSDRIRNCGITCHESVIVMLQRLSDVGRAVAKRPLRYVDVGAALGDCMMAAAYILKGRLHGLAVEAHPGQAERMAETFRINGLLTSEIDTSNRTQILASSLALGSGGSLQHGVVTFAGFVPDPKNNDPFNRARNVSATFQGSTLDDEVEKAGFQWVDALTIFANSAEASILQGGLGLLRARRVGCVLVQVYETDYKTAKAEKALHEGGYRTTTIRGPPSYLPGWVAGSPEEDLISSGGDVCDERFFRWWLEETSPTP